MLILWVEFYNLWKISKKFIKIVIKLLQNSKSCGKILLDVSFDIFKEVYFRMAKCEICGKGVTFGIKVSHSHRRSNRTWKPNIKKVRAVVNGSVKSVNVCTRCLRSGKVQRAV